MSRDHKFNAANSAVVNSGLYDVSRDLSGEQLKTALYRHFDKDDVLLYVGVSLSAVNRLSQHKTASPWFADIVKVTVEYFPSRYSAESAEREAIRKEKPKYNKRHTSLNYYEPSAIVEDEKNRVTYELVAIEPVYSVEDLVDLLRINKKTVIQLIVDGKLGSFGHPTRKSSWTIIKGKPEPLVSGWQLLEYLEDLGALQSATKRYRK